MSKIILRDKIYLPEDLVDTAELEETFTTSLFNENACAKCDFRFDKQKVPTEGDLCLSCDAYQGTYRLYSYTRIDGIDYIGLPIGSRRRISKMVNYSEFEIHDERIKKPFKHKIKFIGSLHDYQVEPCKQMLRRKYGILEAPPRSGKTVMATYIACKLGVKTLILASQKDWLDQFYETIVGDKDAGVKPITNISELEDTGKEVCGFAKTLEDFKKYDIVLSTYQIFLHNKELLTQISKLFGVVIIDEVHGTGADEFSKVVNKFEALSRIGLTATPDRKDTKEFLVYAVVGPVQTVAEVKQLKPKIVFIPTGYAQNYKVWTYMQRGMSKDEERNAIIVDLAVKAVKKGRHVVIPLTLRAHIDVIVDGINEAMEDIVAYPFHGGLPKHIRRETILMAREGKKCKVVVGMRQLVQTGINVPKWDTLIECSPISNTPKFQQETSRILTYMEGKPQPVILHLVDDANIPKACTRKCVSDYKRFGYIITKKMWEVIKPYMSRARTHENIEDTVTKTVFVKRLI